MSAGPSAVLPAATAPARSGKLAALSGQRLSAALAPALGLLAALAVGLLACLAFVQNSFGSYAIAALVALSVVLQVLFVDAYRQHAAWDFKLAVLALLAFVGGVLLYLLPEYLSGWQFNAVVHRSFFAALLMMGTALPAASSSVYYLLGATPQAEDASRYPLVLTLTILPVAIYLGLIAQLVAQGLPNLSWDVISQPYFYYTWPIKILIAGDWPMWTSELRSQVGLLHHLEGTGLLMLMTSVFSLPVGVGAGLYLSEYAGGPLGSLTRFSITALRAISLLILGLTAFSLANYSTGTPLAPFIHGYFFDGYVQQSTGGGSFLTASLVLSLLVIPVIARATEEGCRSLPPELREGSLALGASEETTLWRVVLPWSLPNIVTALLLGCAEAAGSVAVLMFIAGRGDYGVGPFRQVTSLAYLVFDTWYGERQFKGSMGPYQFSAGVLLLIITMGLGILALVVKRWLVRRHRGG